jgi:hypothetical protein
MTTKTITQRTCDICHREIEQGTRYVNASVRGLDFHAECLHHVDGTVIGMLVYDVYYQTDDDPDTRRRLLWDRLGVE